MTDSDNNTEHTGGTNDVASKEAAPKALKRGVDARRAVERPHEVQGVSTLSLIHI